jgi:hypothetical protein
MFYTQHLINSSLKLSNHPFFFFRLVVATYNNVGMPRAYCGSAGGCVIALVTRFVFLSSISCSTRLSLTNTLPFLVYVLSARHPLSHHLQQVALAGIAC